MCATMVGQAVVPLVGGKGHCTGRSTTSSKHWRYGTTRLCRTGWRSPLLTGGASLVRIFLSPGVQRTPVPSSELSAVLRAFLRVARAARTTTGEAQEGVQRPQER